MEPTILATIIYLVDARGKTVTMARKKRNVGKGYWFGYGGKIHPDEDADTCVCRETWEETGGVVVRKRNLERVALIDFYNDKIDVRPHGNPSFRVLCYRTLRWDGNPSETVEMSDPLAFDLAALPWSAMKPGDELFVPQVIMGSPVKGWIRFLVDGSIRASIVPCEPGELVI